MLNSVNAQAVLPKEKHGVTVRTILHKESNKNIMYAFD